MTTKAPAGIKPAPAENVTKKIYTVIDSLSGIIPVDNDRNRLSFCLNMFIEGNTDSLLNAIEQANPWSSKVNYLELEKKIAVLFKDKNIIRQQ